MKKDLLVAILLTSLFCLDAHAEKWESVFIKEADKGKSFGGEDLETSGEEHFIETESIRPYKNQSGQILFWVKRIAADEQTQKDLLDFFGKFDTFSDDENELLREAVKLGLNVWPSHPRAHLPKGTPLEVITTLYVGNCTDMSVRLISGTIGNATHGYDYAAMVRLFGLASANSNYKDEARKGLILKSLENYTPVQSLKPPSGEVEFQYVTPGSDGETWLKYACSVWKQKNKPR